MRRKSAKKVNAANNVELTVKRLSKVDDQLMLTADNLTYPDVKVGNFNETMIWGLATNLHPIVRVFKGLLKKLRILLPQRIL